MFAGGMNDPTAEPASPALALHANVMFWVPNVPQSVHDRLTPAADAADAPSTSSKPAKSAILFIVASRLLLLGGLASRLTVQALQLSPARIVSRGRLRAVGYRRRLPRCKIARRAGVRDVRVVRSSRILEQLAVVEHDAHRHQAARARTRARGLRPLQVDLVRVILRRRVQRLFRRDRALNDQAGPIRRNETGVVDGAERRRTHPRVDASDRP